MRSYIQTVGAYAVAIVAFLLGVMTTVVAGYLLMVMVRTGEIWAAFGCSGETGVFVVFFAGLYLLIGGYTSWRTLRSGAKGRVRNVSASRDRAVSSLIIFPGLLLVFLAMPVLVNIARVEHLDAALAWVGFLAFMFLLAGVYIMSVGFFAWRKEHFEK
jgi:hypothetical protein